MSGPAYPLFPDGRPDDVQAVRQHEGRYEGGIALAVLGGPSAQNWKRLHAELQPDIVLGANGVNAAIAGLPYWMVTENMGYAHRHRKMSHWAQVMEMFYRDTGAQVKMINFKNWELMRNGGNLQGCIKVKRKGYPEGEWPESFSLRHYGEGFMSGWNFQDPSKHSNQQVGTTGAQLLHLAGILGCREVHTIGFELVGNDHFYRYPEYGPDHFRKPENFVMFAGLATQAVWLEGARFLSTMRPYFERDHLIWRDHSHGLFEELNLWCAAR